MKKRWILLLSILGFLLFVTLSVTTLIWTGWLGERLRVFTISKLEELTGLDFEIESLRGNLLTGVVTEGVRITRPGETEPIAQAREITFKYDILDLILGSKDVKRITISEPCVDLKADWSLKEKGNSSTGESNIPDFSVGGLKIKSGRVVGVPQFEEMDSIDLQLSVSAEDNRIDFTIIRCAMKVGELNVKTIVSQGFFEKELLRLKKFQLGTESSNVNLKGVVGAESIHLDGEADLKLEEFAKLFTSTHLAGTLHSSFNVKKGKNLGSVRGTLAIDHGRIDRYIIGDLNGMFMSDFDKVVIDVKRWSAGNGEAEGSIEFDLRSSAVLAEVRGSHLDLSHISDQLKNLSSAINFDAVIDIPTIFPSPRGILDIKLHDSDIRGFCTNELSAKINFEKEFLEIEDMKLTSGSGSATVSGKIFQSAIDLRVATEGLELSQFSEILGVEGLCGELFADILVQGNPRKPFVIGSFWANNLSWPNIDLGYLSGDLSFQYSEENPRIDLQTLVTEGTIFDQKLSDFTLNLSGEESSFHYSTDFTIEENSIQLAGDIQTSHRETRIVNKHFSFSSNGQSITTLSDLVLVVAPDVRLESTRFSICNGWIDLSGNYSSPNLIEIALEGRGIDLQDVAELMGVKQVLRGHLALDLRLQGSFAHPELNLAANIDSFAYEYANLQLVEIKVDYEDGNMNLTRFYLRGDRGEYSVTGYLPVDLSPGKPVFVDREMDIRIDLHGLDPWLFQSIDSYLELKECETDGNLRIYGTPLDPRVSGVLTMHDGQFYSKFLKAFITRTEANVRFEDKEAIVNSLSAQTEEGTLNARGTLHLEKLIPETMDLELDLVKLPVRGIEDVYALIDADFKIQGSIDEPSIEGNVEIDELLITTPFQQKTGPSSERKPLEFQCNVVVNTNRAVWIRNRNANIQLDGELNVKVKKGMLVLSGELSTARGWVNYYDREFEIVKGRLKFTDTPEINPELDILAEIEVLYTSTENGDRISKRDVIKLRITGFLQTPELALSSESGELSELDMFSLITLNMTWNELGSEERTDLLREQAAGRVLDLAASHFTHQIRQAVGLDALRIKVNPIGEEAGAKLTVGKYISRDFYVSYTSEFFSTAKDQFRVEYFVGRRGAVVGERNEEGRYFIGLNYKLRF